MHIHIMFEQERDNTHFPAETSHTTAYSSHHYGAEKESTSLGPNDSQNKRLERYLPAASFLNARHLPAKAKKSNPDFLTSHFSARPGYGALLRVYYGNFRLRESRHSRAATEAALPSLAREAVAYNKDLSRRRSR